MLSGDMSLEGLMAGYIEGVDRQQVTLFPE